MRSRRLWSSRVLHRSRDMASIVTMNYHSSISFQESLFTFCSPPSTLFLWGHKYWNYWIKGELYLGLIHFCDRSFSVSSRKIFLALITSQCDCPGRRIDAISRRLAGLVACTLLHWGFVCLSSLSFVCWWSTDLDDTESRRVTTDLYPSYHVNHFVNKQYQTCLEATLVISNTSQC